MIGKYQEQDCKSNRSARGGSNYVSKGIFIFSMTYVHTYKVNAWGPTGPEKDYVILNQRQIR